MEDGLLFTERRKNIGLLRKGKSAVFSYPRDFNEHFRAHKHYITFMLLTFLGEVGGWKDYFTVAQSELMDKLIQEKLGQTGIKFTYEL